MLTNRRILNAKLVLIAVSLLFQVKCFGFVVFNWYDNKRESRMQNWRRWWLMVIWEQTVDN